MSFFFCFRHECDDFKWHEMHYMHTYTPLNTFRHSPPCLTPGYLPSTCIEMWTCRSSWFIWYVHVMYLCVCVCVAWRTHTYSSYTWQWIATTIHECVVFRTAWKTFYCGYWHVSMCQRTYARHRRKHLKPWIDQNVRAYIFQYVCINTNLILHSGTSLAPWIYLTWCITWINGVRIIKRD
jgi:hypothetical protein